jgi:hypothetical protein
MIPLVFFIIVARACGYGFCQGLCKWEGKEREKSEWKNQNKKLFFPYYRSRGRR